MTAVTEPLLVLRAESGGSTGAGHVARGPGPGPGLAGPGRPAVLVADPVGDLWRTRFGDAGVEVVAPAAFEAGPAAAPGWAVLDGYGFTPDDQRRWQASSGRLLMVDDHGAAGTWAADLVLDQNLGTEPLTYGRGSDRPALLLGPRYALLRREFRPGPAEESAPPAGRASVGPGRVALAAGGGPGTTVAAWFDGLAAGLRDAGLEVVRLEGVADVAATLATVELAVSAAGGTAWELCASGVPSVLVAVAANQVPVAEELGRAGTAAAVRAAATGAEQGPALPAVDQVVAATLALRDDAAARDRMARQGRALVDGRGAVRVATRLRGELLDLRRAGPDDCATLWEWANDPLTRAQSFSPTAIPWDSHVAWFEARLADPASRPLPGRRPGGSGRPRPPGAPRDRGRLGPARRDPGHPRSRGGGGPRAPRPAPGRSAHRCGCPPGRRRPGRPARSWRRIKADNQPSRRAFVAADFDLVDDPIGRGRGWLRYTRQLHEPQR